MSSITIQSTLSNTMFCTYWKVPVFSLVRASACLPFGRWIDSLPKQSKKQESYKKRKRKKEKREMERIVVSNGGGSWNVEIEEQTVNCCGEYYDALRKPLIQKNKSNC